MLQQQLNLVHSENKHYIGVLKELVLEKAFTGHLIVGCICSAISFWLGVGTHFYLKSRYSYLKYKHI